jgi:Tricorn protease C1 domain
MLSNFGSLRELLLCYPLPHDPWPVPEWKQMYHEVWRIERDFFYDPHFHGLNLEEAEKEFAPYLDNMASRADLTYLFREMLSYMSVGHVFVGGGAQPDNPKVRFDQPIVSLVSLCRCFSLPMCFNQGFSPALALAASFSLTAWVTNSRNGIPCSAAAS